MEKICLIIGKCKEELPFTENSIDCDILKDEIEQQLTGLIKNGFNRFISCMRRGADTYAAKLILGLREIYPNISLECMIPYEEQAAAWSEPERDEYFAVISECDKETLFATKYTDNCLQSCIEKASLLADTILYIGDTKTAPESKSICISA